MKYLLALHLFLAGCLAQQESGLRHRALGSGAYGDDQRNTFTSLFEVGYHVIGNAEDDLALIAQALAVSYNGLLGNFENPFDISLEKVDVVEFGPADDNKYGNAKALLAGIGSCSGCPEGTTFTVASQFGGSSKKGGGKGTKKGSSMLDLPMEEEVRRTYEAEVVSLDVDIAAVPFFSEVGSMGGSSDSTGDVDSGKGSKNSKGTKSGKKGKGTGKESKASKEGKKSGKGKGSPPPPTCPPVEPVGTQSGQFESFFDTTYGALSDSRVGLEDAVSALTIAYNRVAERYAAEIMIEESDIFDALTGRRLSFAEAELRRKLQFSLNIVIRVIGFCVLCERNLTIRNQVIDTPSVPINIGGGNTGGGLGILPGGRRRELEEEEELVCLLPGLPTAEEVRLEYNIVLEEISPPNIDDCEELVEIDRVSCFLLQ